MKICGEIYGPFGQVCGRRHGHGGAHDADDETYYARRPILVGRWPDQTGFRQRLAHVLSEQAKEIRRSGRMQ